MTRHKWNQDDTCTVCGLHRERRLRRKLVRTYSKLGRDGIFYDVPIYFDNLDWHYGSEHGFERPECLKIKKQTICK